MKEKRNFNLIYTLIDCLEKVRKKTYNSRNYVVVTVRVLVIILSYEVFFTVMVYLLFYLNMGNVWFHNFFFCDSVYHSVAKSNSSYFQINGWALYIY